MDNSSYIFEAIKKNKTVRWSDDSMPLKIFVGQIVNGINTDSDIYFMNLVKKALLKWQDISDGKITFQLVNDKKSANIHIVWKWKYKILYFFDKSIGKCRSIFRKNDATMIKAVVKICLPPDRPISDINEFYPVLLHEIGHALGLLGHSRDKRDIMYKTTTGSSKLSDKDKNSLKILYSLPPGTLNQNIPALLEKLHLSTNEVKLAHKIELFLMQTPPL